MTYVFHTSAYDVDALVPEVSEALGKRVELASRRRLPGLWRLTDSLAQQGGEPKEMPRGRLIYRRIVGTALIVIGLFMLIPGLREPKELLLPLIAGILGVLIGVHALWSTFKPPKEEPQRAGVSPKRFEDTAKTFLDNLAKIDSTEVRFSEEGMELVEQVMINFEEIEYFIETQSGFLIAWGRQATFLQKKDLQDAEPEEFLDFVSQQVSRT